MSHLPNSSLNMTDSDASSAGFNQITSQLPTSYASSSLNPGFSSSGLQSDRMNIPAQTFLQPQPYSDCNFSASTCPTSTKHFQTKSQVPNSHTSSCINNQQPSALSGRFYVQDNIEHLPGPAQQCLFNQIEHQQLQEAYQKQDVSDYTKRTQNTGLRKCWPSIKVKRTSRMNNAVRPYPYHSPNNTESDFPNTQHPGPSTSSFQEKGNNLQAPNQLKTSSFSPGQNNLTMQRMFQQSGYSNIGIQKNEMNSQHAYQRPAHLVSANQTEPDISYQQDANLAVSPTAQLDLILQVSDPSLSEYLIEFHNRLIHLSVRLNNVAANSILSFWEQYGIELRNPLSVKTLHFHHQGRRLFSEEFIHQVLNIFPLYKHSVKDQKICDRFSWDYKNHHRLMSEDLLKVLKKNHLTQCRKIRSLHAMLFEFLHDEYQQKQFIEQ